MNQSIISKYDLKETDFNFGNSFIYGIKVYSYGEDILMAKCDEMGIPSENILVLSTKNKSKSFVTEEMLIDIDKSLIDELITKHEYCRTIKIEYGNNWRRIN